MLIVMAGLPGTGKSTLAEALAQALTGLVLNKDQLRAALFPPEEIAYSTQQDDLVVHILLLVAAYHQSLDPQRQVILDGRPFTRRRQVQQVLDFCAPRDISVRFIECVCSEAAACQRLDHAVQAGIHMAANRDFSLYRQMKAQAEPIQIPHLVVDTEADLLTCLQQCLDHLQEDGSLGD